LDNSQTHSDAESETKGKHMRIKFISVALLLLSSFGSYAEIPDVNDFRAVPQFPQPADTAFGVVGTSTPSGNFVLWDGDTVYVQPSSGSHELTEIATGYLGDPGFVAIAPDGHTLLMGAGFTPALYLLDLNAPVDFEDGDTIAAPTHFFGGYLSADLIILDRTTDDFMSSELVVLDLGDLASPASRNNAALTFQSVLSIPQADLSTRDLTVPKPLSSYAAKIFISSDRTELYALDGNALELRMFLVADIITAFENSTALIWTDGTLIGMAGDFLSGGVIGKNIDGELLIDGSVSFLGAGGIMYVDPQAPAMILATLDPAGDSPFYNGIYNPVTDELIAIDATFGQPLVAYARETAIAPIPPRNPCEVFDDILAQWDAFCLENSLDPETADIDVDGIPDLAFLLLYEAVACGAESSLQTSTLVAYDLNLDSFDDEIGADDLIDYRELFATVMAFSTDMQTALSLLVAEGSFALSNEYTRVTCIEGECEPEYEEKPIGNIELRTTIEPYSALGDLDEDGTDNITEYTNVVANGGDNADFALAAVSDILDGTSTIRGHASSGGGCFIATAAYGTPLATEINELRDFRDTYLLSTPLGAAFVDTYYRFSPPVADTIAQNETLRKIVRVALTPVLFIIKLVNTSLTMTLGLVLSLLTTYALLRKRKHSQTTRA
jgi:hypothetical protein